MFDQKTKIKKVIVFLLFLTTVLSWRAVFSASGENRLEVYFFDIGQGSSIFFQTPGGGKFLVDGGPNEAILEKLGRTLPFHDKYLDVLLLTHPDADHLAGLLAVARNYEIGLVLETCVQEESELAKLWEKELAERSIRKICLKAGDKLSFGPGGSLEFLYPFSSLEGQTFKDVNESSAVARLDFGENSFLITGDADQKVERGLVFRQANLDVDFLQVGHHGSKTSSGEAFIEAASPLAAIIQAGKNNRYGHPHEETLKTLEKFGAAVWRTDQTGDIALICDFQICLRSEAP